MIFWATSESTRGVSAEYFSTLEKEGAINALIRLIAKPLKSVPSGEWQKWRVIFMIASEDHKTALAMKETRRLTRKDMTLDFRVFVDYEPSIGASFSECIDLLVPALIRTLPYFSKAGIGKVIQEDIRQIVIIAAEKAKTDREVMH